MNSESISLSPFNNMNGGFQKGGGTFELMVIICLLLAAVITAIFALAQEWKPTSMPWMYLVLGVVGLSAVSAFLKVSGFNP